MKSLLINITLLAISTVTIFAQSSINTNPDETWSGILEIPNLNSYSQKTPLILTNQFDSTINIKNTYYHIDRPFILTTKTSDYLYDEFGFLRSNVQYEYHDMILKRKIKLNYSYLKNGNIATFSTDEWDGENWKLDTKTSYEYTTFQKLKKAVSSNFEETYTYDKSNRLTLIYAKDHQNNGWQNFSRRIFKYDKFGNCIKYTEQFWYDNTWNIQAEYNYTYNDKNKVESQIINYY
jgi:hypothetical protein